VAGLNAAPTRRRCSNRARICELIEVLDERWISVTQLQLDLSQCFSFVSRECHRPILATSRYTSAPSVVHG
jgi:hypothetical protein